LEIHVGQLRRLRRHIGQRVAAEDAGFDDEVFSIDVAEPAQLIFERGVKWTLAGEKTDAPRIYGSSRTLCGLLLGSQRVRLPHWASY
jgi:hypothetical protein